MSQQDHFKPTESTEELISCMEYQALQYVDQHYPEHHAIANSVHRDLEVFCKHSQQQHHQLQQVQAQVQYPTEPQQLQACSAHPEIEEDTLDDEFFQWGYYSDEGSRAS